MRGCKLGAGDAEMNGGNFDVLFVVPPPRIGPFCPNEAEAGK